MVPPDQLERPRVTQINVRMDCNGCVQKIKKALYGINGIYDLYIDFPQQKLTIIGWADPEKVMRAIRKTRKVATLCSHTEQPLPAAEESEQQPPQGDQPPPEPNQGPPPESTAAPPPQSEQGPPPEAAPPPTDAAPPPDQHYHHHPDHPRSQATQQALPPRDVGEVHHVIHHHGPPPPPDRHFGYGYRSYSNNSYWNKYSNSNPQYQVEMAQPHHQEGPPQAPAPIHMATTHSYNMHRPSSNVTEYYHQGDQRRDHYDHRYARASPPRPMQQPLSYSYGPRSGMSSYYTERYSNYDDQEPSSSQYYYSNNGNSNGGSYNNGNFTSLFSDENPNACRIV